MSAVVVGGRQVGGQQVGGRQVGERWEVEQWVHGRQVGAVSDRAGPDGVGPGAGRVGRRRTLPTGRAVTGGFAVAAAVVIVFAAYLRTTGPSGRPWVVVDAALPAGTRLTADDLSTTVLRLGDGATASDAYPSPAALIGRTLAVAVDPGELVVRAELQPLGQGPVLRPVPVTVPPTDLVDLGPGDLADVLATSGNSSDPRTAVVLRGARVLSTAQPADGALGTGDDVVTIGVATLAEVQTIVGAEHAGTVDLVVGEPADGTGPG